MTRTEAKRAAHVAELYASIDRSLVVSRLPADDPERVAWEAGVDEAVRGFVEHDLEPPRV